MKIHIVQKGDTIWEIAKQYGVNFEELKELNSHLSSPDMIMPGMKIKIPSTSKHVKTTEKKQQDKTKVTESKKKETVKKEQINTHPLKPLQQPHLGEESLGVEQKFPIQETKKQQPIQQPIQQQQIQQPVQHKQPKPQQQPIKQQIPKQQQMQQPHHNKQLTQHMHMETKHHPVMLPPQYAVNPVHSHFYPPCCYHCNCFMHQHHMPYKQNKSLMRQAGVGIDVNQANQTYFFNE